MTDWRDEANCKGVPTELFFPDRLTPVPLDIRLLCEECPVRLDCLDWAIEHERFGYWGGTHEKARRTLRKSRRIAS